MRLRPRFHLVDLLTMLILVGATWGQMERWGHQAVHLTIFGGVLIDVVEIAELNRRDIRRSWLRACRLATAYFLTHAPLLILGLIIVLVTDAVKGTQSPWNWWGFATYMALWGVNLGVYLALRRLS